VNSNSRQRGVTLLEAMLAMTVASVVLLLGLRVWSSIQLQQNITAIGQNVDEVFLGMKHYYQAECRQSADAFGNTHSMVSTMDPSNLSGTTLDINVQTLLTDGFFTNFNAFNPAVDNTKGSYKGYSAYFTVIQSSSNYPNMNTFACTGNAAGSNSSATTKVYSNANCSAYSSTLALNGTSPTNQGDSNNNTITSTTRTAQWVVQVVVAFNSTYSAAEQSAICYSLNALCTTSAAPSGSTPANCGSNNCSSGGTYLVFQRPVNALSYMTSDSWGEEPYIKSFNQQYTNDSFAAFNGITTSRVSGSSSTTTEDYLCGQ
jgi:type II secretory pathway pseudopilin PulG